MGHKVHPLIFRSKIFPYYNNLWFNNYSYKKNIQMYLDFNNVLKHNNILEIKIKIHNTKTICNIILFSKQHYLESIKNLFYLNIYPNIYINFYILKNPLHNPTYILNYIISNLIKTKISLRKLIKQVILEIYNSPVYNYRIKGIKFIVSGRINGAQKTKVETFKFKHISLQYFNLLVKYDFKLLKTKYGILGFKLWLFLI